MFLDFLYRNTHAISLIVWNLAEIEPGTSGRAKVIGYFGNVSWTTRRQRKEKVNSLSRVWKIADGFNSNWRTIEFQQRPNFRRLFAVHTISGKDI